MTFQTFDEQGVRFQYSPNWMIAEREGNELLKLVTANDSSKIYVGFDSVGPNPGAIAPISEVIAHRVNVTRKIAPEIVFLYINYLPNRLQYDIRYKYLDVDRIRLEHGHLIHNHPLMVILKYDAEIPLFGEHTNDVEQIIQSLSLNPG